MIFLPTREVHDRLRFELACVFVDRSINEPHLWLVAKLPMNLTREIWAGAPISLRIWIVEAQEQLVAVYGLTVYDDPAAAYTSYGPCRSDDETSDLLAILSTGSVPLMIHNENYLPVLYADCRFSSDAAGALLELGPSVVSPLDAGVRKSATDIAELAVNGGNPPEVRASCDLPLTFASSEPQKIHLAGIGEVNLLNDDEGHELERLVFQAFEAMCPFVAFHEPQVGEGKDRQELCDILAVSRIPECPEEGLFVIQSKVASASKAGLSRKTERRANTIQKNISKAIRQVRGAIKSLQDGKTIYRKKEGTSIELDSPIPELEVELGRLNLRKRVENIGHALVLVSDMHGHVDWEAIFFELWEVRCKTGFYCHVLDLQEMMRIMIHCRRRPAVLEHILIERWDRMKAHRTAFVRLQFDGIASPRDGADQE